MNALKLRGLRSGDKKSIVWNVIYYLSKLYGDEFPRKVLSKAYRVSDHVLYVIEKIMPKFITKTLNNPKVQCDYFVYDEDLNQIFMNFIGNLSEKEWIEIVRNMPQIFPGLKECYIVPAPGYPNGQCYVRCFVR